MLKKQIVSSFWVLALLLFAFSGTSAAQILQLAELNTRQIEALDRSKTVVLIPGGILEEHGPYLPSYTDGYTISAYAEQLARAIVARPGWTVLMFPQLPLGNDPANTIGGWRKFPGSYGVRMATLRAVYMDLAAEFGDQGFRWIFLVHNHGAPNHHQALNQASEFFRDAYGGVMVHLFGISSLFLCCDTAQKVLTPEQYAEEGIPIHAGAGEHSTMLFLRPQLVEPGFKSAPVHAGKTFEELIQIARSEKWPGYFGSPRNASAALGAREFAASAAKMVELALSILDGLDYRKLPRYADKIHPANVTGEKAQLDYEKKQAQRQAEWLKSKGLE